MKQTMHVNLRMLLIAVLALLMAFALVACNGDKKNNNETDKHNIIYDDVELTEEMKQRVEDTRKDIDAMLNFTLAACEAGDIDEGYEGYYGMSIQQDNEILYAFDGFGLMITYHIDDDAAQKAYEEAIAENENAVRVGRKVISDNTQYQKILNSQRPASITKLTESQIELMDRKLHRGLDKKESLTLFSMVLSEEESNGHVLWYNVMQHGNGYTMEGIGNDDEILSMISDDCDDRFMAINYTDDSYVRFDEATGLSSYKLIYKPGWHIDEIKNNNGQPTGKYEATYYYNEEAPASVTVPANIGEYEISKARIDLNDNDNMDSVVVEHEMEEVYIGGKIKEITIPLSETMFVEVDFNTALKTVNFGGTMQQWEELQEEAKYENSADEWAHPRLPMTPEDSWYVYVDISFTVVCTNGSITYPKTNA